MCILIIDFRNIQKGGEMQQKVPSQAKVANLQTAKEPFT